MRVAWVLYLLVLIGSTTGCGSRQQENPSRMPLFTGKPEGGSFWKNPLSAAGNEGGEYVKGSRVDVYEQVVVTTSDGLSHVHPHGYYSGLAIKRD
jgi:hypothetical protein